jgi:hypothetical protein
MELRKKERRTGRGRGAGRSASARASGSLRCGVCGWQWVEEELMIYGQYYCTSCTLRANHEQPLNLGTEVPVGRR